MKFLLEDYNIRICKFNKDDLVLRTNFVLLIGRYKDDGTRLPPLNHRRIFVRKEQVAEAGKYIYIPEDQLTDIQEFDRWEFPKPVDTQTKPKYYWLKLKTDYPYKG